MHHLRKAELLLANDTMPLAVDAASLFTVSSNTRSIGHLEYVLSDLCIENAPSVKIFFAPSGKCINWSRCKELQRA